MVKHKMPTSCRLEKVLRSIEELLGNQICQDEMDCCDLFKSYEIYKKRFLRTFNFICEMRIIFKFLSCLKKKWDLLMLL